MNANKWPKVFPPLSLAQQKISNDFMQHWHEVLASHKRYSLIEKFNHGYAVKQAPSQFLHTLEIGAGLGEHLAYEKLSPTQAKHYVAFELRENLAAKIRERFPTVQTKCGDCQSFLPFEDHQFERILAIHVLEHLPNLPAAIAEMYRVCNKQRGQLSVVIPCEGGLMYGLARRLSAQRIFETRYQQSYRWFIEREHVNQPHEIMEELRHYFIIQHKQFFPFVLPSINLNLCIGLTLKPNPSQ